MYGTTQSSPPDDASYLTATLLYEGPADSWYMTNTAAVLPGSYSQNIENFRHIHMFVGIYMCGGTGPADLATRTNVTVWCLKSQQM